MDTGDFVVIVNAEKIAVSGNKRTDKFVYRTPATRAACASARSAR
jgi:ribosomal protein L13